MAIEIPSIIFVHFAELFYAVQTEICLAVFAGIIYVLASVGVAQKKAPSTTPAVVSRRESDGEAMARTPPAPKPQPQKQSVCLASKADRAKLIRDHGKEGRLDAAVALFESMKVNGSGVNCLSYNSVLEAAVQCSDMSLALKYLAEAVECNCADTVSYNTVLKGHLAAQNNALAWELVSDMRKTGVAPNHCTYHTLLHSTVQAKNRSMAWKCIACMRQDGLKPTTITCTIICKLVASGGFEADMMRAMTVVDELEDAIDETMFASLAEACLLTKRLDILTAKWQNSKAANKCLKLPAHAYGAMIKAYGQAHDLEMIWVLWNDMSDSGVQPTTITLGCMVEALVMSESVASAWQLVQKIWEEDVCKHLINNVVCSTILKGFAMSRQMDKVLMCYDVMRERNIECNTVTYNTLLNALVRCGEVNRVPGILEDMHTASPKIEADAITYSTVMKAYCSTGDLDKALALLKDFEDCALCTPDEVMFNSLLEGCARQQRLADAMILLDKMGKASVLPSNYTLSIMVKLLGRAKRLDQAFQLVEEVSSQHGFRPNIFVYTCLIQACFHNKQLGRAIQLHNQIVNDGCLLDEKAYTCIVHGFIRAGAIEKAIDAVHCAFGFPNSSLALRGGCAPGVDAACLQQLCSKFRPSCLPQGAELVQNLLAKVESNPISSRKSRHR